MKMDLTPQLARTLDMAEDIARARGQDFVSTDAVLLALIRMDFGVPGHALYQAGLTEAKLEAHARLLFDLAVIAEGSRVKDPSALARRVGELLLRDGA